MPRLLLVDDNPSIHRIAESLLAHTDVELICVDSAAEALDRIARGERFDVALVDTTMPGMDGWTLLGRLRAMEETALMPIALMAGVLDPVDPAKLAQAPVQGFLKKPIELRELGDRVKALLATPVVSAPATSPFTTMPARPAKDLVRMAEASYPEFRPEARPVDAPPAAEMAPLATEDDLLVLTAEDLWPEDEPSVPEPAEPAEPVEAAAAVPEIQLELEELDLESLHDLAAGPLAAEAVPVASAATFEVAAPVPVEDDPITFSGLEDLGDLPADIDFPPLPEPEPPVEAGTPAGPLVGAAFLLDEASGSATQIPEPEPIPEVVPAPEIESTLEFEAVPEFEPVPAFVPVDEPALAATSAAPGQGAAVPGQAPTLPDQVPAVPGQATLSPEQAQALLQALLVDPVLVDALVKAVVARMGDQVVREIAWEVMPDLAGRLQR